MDTWVLEYLRTSSSTQMPVLWVMADKPCLGIASSYRAAGRYAIAPVPRNTTTTTTNTVHHHKKTTTTQPHHSQFSPKPPLIPFPLTPNSPILTDFSDSTLDASAASATIPPVPCVPAQWCFFLPVSSSTIVSTQYCNVPCRDGLAWLDRCSARLSTPHPRRLNQLRLTACGCRLPLPLPYEVTRLSPLLRQHMAAWLNGCCLSRSDPVAGRTDRFASLPHKESVSQPGRSVNYAGHQPTHSPARTNADPGSKAGLAGAQSFCVPPHIVHSLAVV